MARLPYRFKHLHHSAPSQASYNTRRITHYKEEERYSFCHIRHSILLMGQTVLQCRTCCCLLLGLYYSFPVIKSINLKKGWYPSANISFIWPLLINLYVHSKATKSCHLDVLWKQMALHSILNYTLPCLLEKQVLKITRKVIFTVAWSSGSCPAESQLGQVKRLLFVERRTGLWHDERSLTCMHLKHIHNSHETMDLTLVGRHKQSEVETSKVQLEFGLSVLH